MSGYTNNTPTKKSLRICPMKKNSNAAITKAHTNFINSLEMHTSSLYVSCKHKFKQTLHMHTHIHLLHKMFCSDRKILTQSCNRTSTFNWTIKLSQFWNIKLQMKKTRNNMQKNKLTLVFFLSYHNYNKWTNVFKIF